MRDIPDVSPPFFAVLAVLGVCLAMLLFWELGRRVGVSYLEGERQGTTSAAAGYIVADFELPRLGLIQEHDFDQVLMDLLQSMK